MARLSPDFCRTQQHAQRQTGALLVTASNEDGILGRIEESVARDGRDRREIKRKFDDAEVVLTQDLAQRRDWNGFIRPIEGEELRRFRAQIFETQTLVFGPPVPTALGQIRARLEGSLYVVELAAPGGLPVTWYIDRNTWLPVKSVRPGEDNKITTVYEDPAARAGNAKNTPRWRDLGNGVLTPATAKVSETDKPDNEWRRISMNPYRPTERSFTPPKPGPSDVRMDAHVPPVPFTLESSHIVLQVSVNGRPPIGFILDTGADQEVINQTRTTLV